MSQSTRASSSVSRTTKPSDSLRPHYYTTFQNYCCGPKSNSKTPPENKDLLPIPQKYKIEAEDLFTHIYQILVEDLAKITEYTSVIPNIFFDKNDNIQIQRYLIDRVMLKTLRDADIINWSLQFKTLYPIRTSGNGNCLLHAVLIAMIGIHDLNLYLRDQLAQFMNDNKDLLKNHWKTERLKSDKSYGISSEDSTLDEEWKELCDLVRYENSEDGQAATHLQFLEAVHIFSISNMLHRPIIVLSEDVIRNKNGEPISVNDLFGIYLPIISSPNECINEPIVLAYNQSHFCPLQTNDISRERTPDNLLPLYPSINHIFDQNLLPIRFLGDDVTVERSKNLLQDYLRIREVDYTLDSNSPPIRILCAELGNKHLSSNDSFFLLYHNYLNDFFEIQKPKAIEEERKREREREFEDYATRYTPYDTRGRSIITQDPLSSRSSRANNTTNDIPLHSLNNRFSNQQYSYDGVNNNGTYMPRNSAVYIDNSLTQPRQSQRSPDYAKTAQRDTNADHTRPELLKQLYSTRDSDNISNLNNNGKMINSVNINLQGNDSKLNRERPLQNPVPIPIQIVAREPLSNDQNLTVYEQRNAFTDKCLLCDHLFRSTESNRFCPDCDYRIHTPTVYNDVPSRSSSRSGPTNMYLSSYNHGYTPALSPIPKTRTQRKIICPHCKNPNIFHSLSGKSDFHCSACQNPLSSSYHY